MTFAFPTLLWFGIPLLAATLAVHLLNLRRQKPVAWAAMDFLLASERQNRTWINLKEWLLLAVRMLLIALAVFALAKPLLEEFNLTALADSRVLHLVVLDDSYSMSDAGPKTAAWPDALEAVDRVLSFASSKPTHQAAVVRTSQLLPNPHEAPAAAIAETPEQVAELRQTVAGWEPSQTSGSLLDAIGHATRLAETAPTGLQRIAYLVTDGRQRDAAPLEALREKLEALQNTGAEVRWVRCAASQSQNLGVTDLKLLPGPAASGVELTMSVTVANHGLQPASGVMVQVARDGKSLPALDLGAIAAGKSATRQFAVLFREAGQHRVTAQLESDSVIADNARHATLSLAPQRKVLLLDGSPGRREGAPYAAALRPNTRLNTGWTPELIRVDGKYQQADFSEYAAVFLLDVSNLPEATAIALRNYVRRGGGLFVGAGPDINASFYNQQLIGNAKDSLADFTLDKPRKPKPADDPSRGDLAVTAHPLFKIFAGERDSFLSLVNVDYLYGAGPIAADSGVSVLASHVSGEPLMLESTPGEGRVVFLLTSVGQSQNRDESWSNLSSLPVFPVLVLELAAYVAEPSLRPNGLQVAQPWRDAVQPTADQRVQLGRVESDGAAVLLAEVNANEFPSLPAPTETGVYQIELVGARGAESQLIAVNVDAEEGDLTLAAADPFAAMLSRLGVPVETAVALSANAGEGGPSPLPPLLGLIAVVLLLGEQALAISASYHEPSSGGSR